mmetsp:Transcript_12775/g.18359  ORF Transcript_12775/g.18359 Transcript_12775/m.18359 type:complete len:268 (-) Transcript_12775:183-986(-)
MQVNLDGFIDVSPNMIHVDANSGDSTGNMFIDEQVGSISGKVQVDTNNDGTGDQNVPGVKVVLSSPGGTVIATTTTNGRGNYVFSSVPLGTYVVMEMNTGEPTFFDVSDIDGTNDDKIRVTITPNRPDSRGNDFVDEPGRVITGSVEQDTNGDGTGDTGIGGVLISVFAPGQSTPVATILTNSDGSFSFPPLPPGVYTVTEQTPNGLIDVSDSDGGDPNSVTVNTSGGNFVVAFVDAKPTPTRKPTKKPTKKRTKRPQPYYRNLRSV